MQTAAIKHGGMQIEGWVGTAALGFLGSGRVQVTHLKNICSLQFILLSYKCPVRGSDVTEPEQDPLNIFEMVPAEGSEDCVNWTKLDN